MRQTPDPVPKNAIFDATNPLGSDGKARNYPQLKTGETTLELPLGFRTGANLGQDGHDRHVLGQLIHELDVHLLDAVGGDEVDADINTWVLGLVHGARTTGILLLLQALLVHALHVAKYQIHGFSQVFPACRRGN